jgi:hypothetical protein
MKFSLASIAVVALAAQGTVANTWFGNAGVYSDRACFQANTF